MHPTLFYHLHFITLKFNTVQLHIVSQDIAPHSQFYLYFVTPINSMCPANLCKISQFTFNHHGRVPNNPKQVQTRGRTCGCSSFTFLPSLCKCVQMCASKCLQACAIVCKAKQFTFSRPSLSPPINCYMCTCTWATFTRRRSEKLIQEYLHTLRQQVEKLLQTCN